MGIKIAALSNHPIQKKIIGLALSLVAVMVLVLFIHTDLINKSSQIENQLDNQTARQDIGISIYQRLFAAKAFIFKLSMLDNTTELQIVKNRFDANLQVIMEGLNVLQNGGIFEDNIATNIPGKNIMHLIVSYKKPRQEGYILEVLELGPALHKLNEQVVLLSQLVNSQILENDATKLKNYKIRVKNLIKAINSILQRSQEQAARVLYDSHERKESLTIQLQKTEQLHNRIRLPVISLALCFAAYLLYITLVRVEKVISERKKAEEQLQLLLDTTVEGIYGVDIDGKTTFVNPAASRMLGFAVEELVGKENHQLIHHTHANGDHYPGTECRILEVLKGGVLQTLDTEVFWRKDGSYFPVEYSSNPIHHANEIVGAVVNFRDITERKQTEKQIRTLSQAVEQSPVSVILTDIKGNIEYVNKAFEQATGYMAEEVLGKNPKLLNSGETPSNSYQDLWQAISNGKSWQGEFQNRKKNGILFWERAYIAPVLDEAGKTTHYLGIKEDISKQKQQEEKILRQATYDSLTHLPNRFLALDRLSQLLKDAQRNKKLAAVLFLDLDGFKKINDSMSHEVGDQLLIQAAKRLSDSVRNGDTVSRLGGDEFIVLMGDLNSIDDVYPLAEKLLMRFQKAFLLDSRELVLTVSIGIAIYPNDGNTPAELLRNADMAMYHSKDQGRNTYHYFTESMNQGVSRRLSLEEQLHGALERNEFYLHYQPFIDIKSARMIGVEALLRWKNPTLGQVSPEEFIPIAEQTGQIVSIGRFVLDKALAMLSEWQRQYCKNFRIAINISPRQFRAPDLFVQIQEALTQAKVSSGSLELEITEGVLMSGHAYISQTLTALNDLGVRIAMDDFGTGYSSLSYLRSFPFDTLKIDRSFVNDMSVDSADRELVYAAIAMGHSLGLKVVAEGIETEEQLALLAKQGTEFGQGYLFSKPVPANEISKMLKSLGQAQY